MYVCLYYMELHKNIRTKLCDDLLLSDVSRMTSLNHRVSYADTVLLCTSETGHE